MKKQIAGLLTGLLVCSAFLTGCSKNEATEAVKESTEDENEGTGDTKDADSKKDTNRKSDKQDSDKSDENSEESETTEAPEENLDKVGVLLPEEGEDINSSLERTELKSRLEEAGYEAAMYFAGDDSDTQAEQIRELLQDEKLKALVISPVDPYGLTDVLEEASELSIPVIDYDNLIMDTPNVKYFVTFNMRAIGKEIAKNIVEKEELDKVREDRGARTIEFLMGSPDDRDALFFYNGVMEKLQEYFDDGTLVCTSRKLTFDDTAVMRSGRNTAKNDMAEILSQNYTEGAPDIICTGADDLALGAVDALEDAGYVSGEDGWPMITGGGCEAEAVTAVIQGKIEDDLLFDNRVLANDCVTMVDAILKGEKPEISDYEQYDNGTKIVGTVTSDIQLIDADNYQMLVDDGYYEEKEIMPEATATPTPTVTSEATVTEEPDIDENIPEAASASSEKEETEISGTPTPEETATPTPSEKAEKGADA